MRKPLAIAGGVVAVALVGGLAAIGPGMVGERFRERSWTLPPAQTVTVEPGPVTLVCPPSVVLPDGADIGDAEFTATPGATGSRDVLAEAGHLASYTSPLTAQPVLGQPFTAAGTGASLTSVGDLRGLAAAACVEASTTTWFLAGGTEIGSTATLFVQNPSEHAASVTINAYGAFGPVALGGGGQFPLAPGASQAVSLEAIAPGQRLLGVGVTSAGARVVTHLQTQAIAGLLPRGTDLIAGVATPSTLQAVVGLVSEGQVAGDAEAPVLRLLAPGDGTVTVPTIGADAADSGAVAIEVSLSIYGPMGQTFLAGAEFVELTPSTVAEINLGGLPAGPHTVVVESSAPVLATGSFTRPALAADDETAPGPLPTDTAWVPGVPMNVSCAQSQDLAFRGLDTQASPATRPTDACPSEPPTAAALPGMGGETLILTGVPLDREGIPTGSAEVTVRVYRFDGSVGLEHDVTLWAGVTTEVVLPQAAGAAMNALVTVETVSEDGVVPAWALQLTAQDDSMFLDRLISVVPPTASLAAPGVATTRVTVATGSVSP